MPTLRAMGLVLATTLATSLVIVPPAAASLGGAAPSQSTRAAVAPVGVVGSTTGVAPAAVVPGGTSTDLKRVARSGKGSRSEVAARAGDSTTARTDGSRAATLAATTPLPGGFHALPAHRLLDTRTGLGGPKAPVASGQSVSVQVTGREGVPATGVGAVALTVTAVGPTGPGYVTAFASGTPAPTASSLNYAAGEIVANLVISRVSSDGKVDLRVGGSGSTHLLAEVVGYLDAGAAVDAGTYTALDPSRLLDTRSGVGAPKATLKGGQTLTLAVAGRGGVPSSSVGAAVLNVTAVGGTASGYLTVGPVLGATVSTSNLNYVSGQVRANLVVVPLSAQGTVDVHVTSGGTVNVVADVVGWVSNGPPVNDGAMAAVAPTRVLDTRTDGGGAVQGNGWADVGVVGVGGVPTTNVHAVILNVTATQGTAVGRVSVLPSAPNLPTGSQVQYAKGRNDANLVIAPVSPDGWVDLFVSSSGSVHLVADLVGYVLGPPVDTTPPASVTALTLTQPAKNAISLSWVNPADGDFTGVTVRRVLGTTPSQDPLEGTVVAETTGTSFTDSNLTPGTAYSYTLWAHDGFPNVSQPASVSATTTSLSWASPSRLAPYVGGPRAVSCPSTTWCMVGDWSGQALTWNGSAWSAPSKVFPVGDADQFGGFQALSCTSSSFCVGTTGAGGLVTFRNGAWGAPVTVSSASGVVQLGVVDCVSTTFCMAASGDGWVTRFNGTSWSTATKVSSYFWSLDCVSTTFCMGAGQDMSVGAGYAARWNGTTWTTWKIEPAGYSTYAVSCVSSSFCMVLDGGGRYVKWNGSSWSAPTTFDVTNGFQGREVSCTSTTFCIGVDPERGAVRWNGSTWSSPTRITTQPVLNGGLDCASSSMCVAIEQNGRYSRFNGTSWSWMTMFDPTRGGLRDLSCGAATSCLATDERGYAYRWNGSGWSAPSWITFVEDTVSCASSAWCLTVAAPTSSYRILSGSTWGASTATPAGLGDPSCPAPGWCLAFDSEGRAYTLSSGSWSAGKAVFTSVGGGQPVRVSCASAAFCLAVSDDQGYWSRWNGTSWSTPKDVDSAVGQGGSVSCASSTMCLLLDDQGDSYVFNGTSWRVVTRGSGPSNAYDVDCAATNFCAALTINGDIATFNGVSWNDTVQSTGLTGTGEVGDDPMHIDCPAVYTCVVGGRVSVTSSQ